MVRIKVLGAALIAVLAVGAASASGALARETVNISEEGPPVRLLKNGDIATVDFSFGYLPEPHAGEPGGCQVVWTGTILKNQKPNVKFTFPLANETPWICNEHTSVSASQLIVTMKHNLTGTVKFSPSLVITDSRGPRFEIKKLTGKFGNAGVADLFGTAIVRGGGGELGWETQLYEGPGNKLLAFIQS